MDIVILNSAITKVTNLSSIVTINLTESSVLNKFLSLGNYITTTINLISEIESGE